MAISWILSCNYQWLLFLYKTFLFAGWCCICCKRILHSSFVLCEGEAHSVFLSRFSCYFVVLFIDIMLFGSDELYPIIWGDQFKIYICRWAGNLFKTFWYFYKFLESIFLEYTPTKSMGIVVNFSWINFLLIYSFILIFVTSMWNIEGSVRLGFILRSISCCAFT
jgi:hypothetical protein